ncbi:nucleotide sugar dehydrogenase [uncultured Clostridium sp.]|uniref:nucleotide sugar dehydrogenase n=1 Tax=uncultured Clostridium sp. TaxID=59620 RepID=UPI0025FF86C6|nr:nucleotide sugar dehydrogenase [uncultured Clostridium sp.]
MFKEVNKEDLCISVVGLGYVGMPLAITFAEKYKVIGFDTNSEKITKYKEGIDVTNEVGNDILRNTKCNFTNDEKELKKANFYVIAVPTPIKSDRSPDLEPVISASKIVGRNLNKNSIVVYESTVYPGVTEDICVPILEKESNLKCGIDFKVGYSPERINPGDKVHTLKTIKKIVSGMDDESLEIIAEIYGSIIDKGVYKAKTIKIAEAAKVIENSQRDINIAFMNELSMVFDKMGIDTKSVIEAASTKWNFLKFTPGLVGGHCIGVDPYYFIYKAEQLGYHSQIVLSGRKINDDMPKYVVENIIKKMIEADKKIKGSKVLVMGVTFKEDCNDVRNSKVINIIRELKEYGIRVQVVDPVADLKEVYEKYKLEVCNFNEVKDEDAIVIAVAHKEFKEMNIADIESKFNPKNKNNILIDIKGIIEKDMLSNNTIYWRL